MLEDALRFARQGTTLLLHKHALVEVDPACDARCRRRTSRFSLLVLLVLPDFAPSLPLFASNARLHLIRIRTSSPSSPVQSCSLRPPLPGIGGLRKRFIPGYDGSPHLSNVSWRRACAASRCLVDGMPRQWRGGPHRSRWDGRTSCLLTVARPLAPVLLRCSALLTRS